MVRWFGANECHLPIDFLIPSFWLKMTQVDEAALADAMRTVPLGAGVLAGAAVALLVVGYLAIYMLVFMPRGTVG